jgi:hypothetical protein
MGQVVQVNGDYNIKTGSGANITLDTGPRVGNTIVTGNLVVNGTTLSVNTQNVNLKDNILVLNQGEIGPGVTLQYSGIEVQRSQGETTPSASFLWNEADQSWNIAQGVPGSLNYTGSNLRLRKILTNPTTDNGDLTLIGSGTGIVKVTGTSNYATQVAADVTGNAIPNKYYVDQAIINNPSFQIINNDSRVIVTDKDIAGSTAYYTNQTGYSTFSKSAVSILVDGIQNTQFYSDRVYIQNLEIQNNVISNPNTNQDVNITTYGTGKVVMNYSLRLVNISGTPAPVSGSTQLYSGTPSLGTTGLFFVNSARSGELINKNKALLFSMLF